VKWSHILELAVSCRKLLEGGQAQTDAVDGMNIDEKAPACPNFGALARKLRLKDESALSDVASMMKSSDRMTNHEFVTYILPALHGALVDTHGPTGNSQFCLKALEAFTDLVESAASAEVRADDDSRMSVDEVSQDVDATMVDSYQQAPMVLGNRVPSIALRRIQDILSFSENVSVLHVLWDKKRNGTSMALNGSKLKSLAKPIELNVSAWHPATASSTVRGDTAVFVEPLLPSLELERHVIRAGRIENEAYLSFCRR